MEEIWKDIPGFAGDYEVSNLGRVKSRIRGERILRPGVSSNGYLTVALRGRSHTIHELVLGAFVGPRPAGMVTRHLDGDRRNSCLANLAYGTPAENSADAAEHGTKVTGGRYPNAKLNDIAAFEVRLFKGRISQSELAKQYQVSPAAIQAVHDGRTWKHV